MSANVLLRDVRLVGSAASREPVDVLIDDGRVAAVGPGVPADSSIERIELGGRWLSPGMWDHHVHFDQYSLVRRRLDVSSARSAREAASLVADRIRVLEPGETLVGFGFRDALWPDVPDELMLDAASAGAPVVLISGDLHCAWVNTAAREVYGLGDHPSGLLREAAAFALNDRLSATTDEQLDRNALDAAAAASARGVVGVVELEMHDSIEPWRRRVAAGADGLRVRVGIYPQHLDDAIARGLRTGDPVEGTGGLVTIGPAKILTDGSLNTRTAFCHDPYPGTGGHGMSTVGYDELVAFLERVTQAGLVPTVHAIGDAANTLALDAFAATGSTGSIEHAQLVAERDFSRFAELGVVASVQPEHAMDDRDVADVIWAGRTGRAFAFDSLLRAGARIQLGSDAPVAPLDPWVSMAAAVSRARDGREPWHPEQRVTALAALRASTGVEGIAVGMIADLVATDLDPLVATDVELRAMPVAATLLAGRMTHSSL